MNLFNFDYFIERSEILTEMARSIQLFGPGAIANNKFSELMKELSQTYPGKANASYRIAVIKYFIGKFNETFEIYKFTKEDCISNINEYFSKISQKTFKDPDKIKFPESILSDEKLLRNVNLDQLISEFFQNTLSKSEYKAFADNLKVVIRNNKDLKYFIQFLENLTLEDSNEYVLTGDDVIKFTQDGKNDLPATEQTLKLLIKNPELSDKLNSSDFLNSLNLEDLIAYAEGAKTRSWRSKGMESSMKQTTEMSFSEFSQLEKELAPILKELNRKMHYHNISLSKGGQGKITQQEEIPSNAGGEIGLPFSTLYIDNILEILAGLISERSKIGQTSNQGIWGKRDETSNELIPIKSRYLNVETPISRSLLTSFSPAELQSVADGFESIYDKFENDNLEYTSEDLIKLINKITTANPKLAELLNYLKVSLTPLENNIEQTKEKQSFDGYEDVLISQYFPDADSEDFKTFVKWFNAKSKYKAKLKNDLLDRYDKILISNAESKINSEEIPDESNEEIFSYMTEQVNKDKLTNNNGSYVGKGIKQPINYWHWMQKGL